MKKRRTTKVDQAVAKAKQAAPATKRRASPTDYGQVLADMKGLSLPNIWKMRQFYRSCRKVDRWLALSTSIEIVGALRRQLKSSQELSTAPRELQHASSGQRECETFDTLRSAGRTEGIKLVHSRFRLAKRDIWRQRLLSRTACTDGVDCTVVATQVVDVVVDVSAGCLITELAPCPVSCSDSVGVVDTAAAGAIGWTVDSIPNLS